jgi:8-oxo-dGTP pyrophosphatase MutT (NUDIX family)
MKTGVDHVGVYVSAICHDGKGNVLYTKRGKAARDEHGRWNLGAGGSLEVGETIEECLAREMKEEIGTTPIESEYLGVRELFRVIDGIASHWIGFYFKVLVNKGEVKIVPGEETDAHLWQSFHDMPTPMISKHEELYEMYKHKF